MSSLADLKSVIARMDDVVERVEALRPTLNEQQVVGLDALKANNNKMYAELHDLLMDKPKRSVPPPSPVAQKLLDATVLSLNITANMLQTWLDGAS